MPVMTMSSEVTPTRADPALTNNFLSQAFASFTEAAGSLERSYVHLQKEVVHLRRELEERNAALSRSLEENVRIRQSLHQILEGLPCGVLVVDARGQISIANPAGRSLLHSNPRSLDELAGTYPELRALLDQVQHKPGEWELEVHSPSGERNFVAARHASLGDPGSSHESVFILQDVTERKRYALERERLERQQALAGMSTVLAHEIRNPLASLELFAGLLAESDLEQENRRFVDHLQAGLRLLGATVNNVLRFHKSPAPRLTSVNLEELLCGVRDFLLPLAKQSSVRLVLDNQATNTEMPADRHALEQVLLNLTINGLRFTPLGGTLTIAARANTDQPKGFVLVEVRDSGPGIAPEILEKIFEPGFTTRPDSPGLGLAVCRTIVEQHGGTIEACNRVEGGASFVIRLPLGDKA
jgi:two-component system sensor histidine kinase FlrB